MGSPNSSIGDPARFILSGRGVHIEGVSEDVLLTILEGVIREVKPQLQFLTPHPLRSQFITERISFPEGSGWSERTPCIVIPELLVRGRRVLFSRIGQFAFLEQKERSPNTRYILESLEYEEFVRQAKASGLHTFVLALYGFIAGEVEIRKTRLRAMEGLEREVRDVGFRLGALSDA